jgi:hypothetical protein
MPPKKRQKVADIKLNLGKMEPIPEDPNEGRRVLIRLKPNKKANYTAYQNITVKIGDDKYVYSEAWSLNTTKSRYDTFSVPDDLRHHKYKSTAEMWIEKGGVDSTYKVGKLYSTRSPWGKTKGRWKLREIPANTKVTRRETVFRWSEGGKITATEKRSKHIDLTNA